MASAGSLDAARARRAWRAARSFDELCALSAQFLERRLGFFPGWGAPEPDTETDAIAARLARLNRAGLLTLDSQPAFEGERAGRAVRQRAFVAGFARADTAARLCGRAAGPAIEVRAFALGDGPGEPEPVTLENGAARVLAGHAAHAEELALFRGAVSPDALRALCAVHYVTAWDPVWGRADALWEGLERRLGVDAR